MDFSILVIFYKTRHYLNEWKKNHENESKKDIFPFSLSKSTIFHDNGPYAVENGTGQTGVCASARVAAAAVVKEMKKTNDEDGVK